MKAGGWVVARQANMRDRPEWPFEGNKNRSSGFSVSVREASMDADETSPAMRISCGRLACSFGNRKGNQVSPYLADDTCCHSCSSRLAARSHIGSLISCFFESGGNTRLTLLKT